MWLGCSVGLVVLFWVLLLSAFVLDLCFDLCWLLWLFDCSLVLDKFGGFGLLC